MLDITIPSGSTTEIKSGKIKSFYKVDEISYQMIDDTLLYRDDLDWGIYSLDTVMDNTDLRKTHFLALTHFGHHALHHLFPIIDHGVLPKLYPVLFRTMKEFEVELDAYPWYHHVYGQLKQLARIHPNPIDSLEKYRNRNRNKAEWVPGIFIAYCLCLCDTFLCVCLFMIIFCINAFIVASNDVYCGLFNSNFPAYVLCTYEIHM